MNYRNSEMKIDQIVNYLNEEKINLTPAFQRGHVWRLSVRQKLIENIVQGKPIPAIFLYKEASGSKYSYNILDGKQRLESLILFIGNSRPDFRIKEWKKYFFGPKPSDDADFAITLPKGAQNFKALDESVVRDFREYAIPTIEISLNDGSSLDEIINLFVDINQQGAKVNRFDIVKAMKKNSPLVRDVFSLISVLKQRSQDVQYKAKDNEFTAVLKKLQIVEHLVGNSRIDRMWERLLEIVLFARTSKHRKPAEVLKSFISGKEPQDPSPKLTSVEKSKLRKVFKFLQGAYRNSPSLLVSRLASDQTHFYTMVTSLLDSDLLDRVLPPVLEGKLSAFAQLLESKIQVPDKKLASVIKKYQDLATQKTTDTTRRGERQQQFVIAVKMIQAVEKLPEAS